MPLDEAHRRLAERVPAFRITDTESLPTAQALGRMLAESIDSRLNVPPADNSAMDGYALRVADVAQAGACLPVSQRIAAGHPGGPLQPGTAARIFTGAPVPAGADAVVMQEACELVPGDPPQVRIHTLPSAGQWVRRQGEDVRLGAQVLATGQRLNPQALGLAAAVGAATLRVVRRPRVALFSTGDELVMPGEPLPPGAIYNSNRFMLRGLLEAAGCTVDDLGIVPDRLDATRAALRAAAQGNDLILTSGGVSVGEEDHLRPAAQAEGSIEHWQLAIKPGKPLAVGHIRRGAADRGPDGAARGDALLIGLPGNPVSSFVTFLLIVAPLLRQLQGGAGGLPPGLPLRADFEALKADGRREFLRARLNPAGGLELFPNQSSGVLTSAVWADGLIDHPAGAVIHPGDTVRFLPMATLIGA